MSGDLIERYHSGLLGPYERAHVAEHLRECVVCLRATSGAIAATGRGDEETVPEPPRIPEQIGPYRILRLIGRGGMGAVYEARHLKLDRVVALKILPQPMAVGREFHERFDREARVIAKLDHPNIVRATDAGETDGIPYLALELLDGIDVARLVQSIGPLSVADAVEIAFQAALGLAHLHERGIVHRDVKPSNLMLTSDGAVKILDLGLALTAEAAGRPDGRLTGITYLGTHDYMAPEQWVAPTAATAKVDCYGLGCTLFQMLAGRAPFGGPKMSPQAKMKAHLEHATPALPDRGDIPVALIQLVNRMIAKPPGDRPTAREISQSLFPFRAANRLVRLIEQSRLAPVTGFSDGEPTHEDPPAPAVAKPATRFAFPPVATPILWFALGLMSTLILVASGWGIARYFGVGS